MEQRLQGALNTKKDNFYKNSLEKSLKNYNPQQATASSGEGRKSDFSELPQCNTQDIQLSTTKKLLCMKRNKYGLFTAKQEINRNCP